jgi:hypothetical protein
MPIKKLLYKTYLTLGVLFPSNLAYSQKGNISIFESKYCFQNASHSLAVQFKIKNDTAYLFYSDIIDNGKYLNDFDGEDDYAGKFALRDFGDNEVNLKIKSYRDPSFTYLLNLKLNSKTGWFYWNIDQKEPVGFLVKHATLKICR